MSSYLFGFLLECRWLFDFVCLQNQALVVAMMELIFCTTHKILVRLDIVMGRASKLIFCKQVQALELFLNKMYCFPFYCHFSSTREDPDFLHDTLLSCYPPGHLSRSPGRLRIWSFLDTMLSHPFISSSPFSSSCLHRPAFSFIGWCSATSLLDALSHSFLVHQSALLSVTFSLVLSQFC